MSVEASVKVSVGVSVKVIVEVSVGVRVLKLELKLLGVEVRVVSHCCRYRASNQQRKRNVIKRPPDWYTSSPTGTSKHFSLAARNHSLGRWNSPPILSRHRVQKQVLTTPQYVVTFNILKL